MRIPSEWVEVFLAGDAEEIFDALVLKAADEKIGGFQNGVWEDGVDIER